MCYEHARGLCFDIKKQTDEHVRDKHRINTDSIKTVARVYFRKTYGKCAESKTGYSHVIKKLVVRLTKCVKERK